MRRGEHLADDQAEVVLAEGVIEWMVDNLSEAQREIVLELWGYRPEKPPEGLVKSAVATGALTRDIAEVLSADEITAALAAAWDPLTGELAPDRALRAALDRVAGSADPERLMSVRSQARCGARMPRARAACVRRRGHPGAHRATP